MDSSRYERIRELFLAAEELPPGEQESFLRQQAGGDVELFAEVASLLAEHDSAAAQAEGQCAVSASIPSPITPEDLSADLSSIALESSEDAGERESDLPPLKPSDANKTHRGDTSSGGTNRAMVTQQGALRTHAAPRYDATPKPQKPLATMAIWAEHARKNRRRNSGWLWLAALLPTALVGWWTYDRVGKAMESSIVMKLEGAAENTALATDRFLTDQALLAQSWARQLHLRIAVEELVQFAASDASIEELQKAPEIAKIQRQLKEMSGNENIRFIVWNSSYRVIASWLKDGESVGNPVDPKNAGDLARVMVGETVLFGPVRIQEEVEELSTGEREPVIALIVPVENREGKIIASMLVRSKASFEQLNHIFADFSIASGMDAYAINSDGIMVTESPHAVALATRNQLDRSPYEIATELRVCDPGFLIDGSNRDSVRRNIRPVTVAAAGAISNHPDVLTDSYPNYAGTQVVGAWRWLDRWQIGIIIEEEAANAFAPARMVRFSFLLLGSLLSITAFLAAAKIARTSTREQAAVHPLSRYEVMGELGSGGMGVVFRGRHRQLGRDVALKVLRSDRHAREDKLRFEREAKLAASLKNPHSVMIYDYGHGEQGESFCVMQFLEGLTLHEVVTRSGFQSVGRTLSVLRQICDAISEAHSLELMHRDIKPRNIMLSLDPSVGDWAVVFDYGLAKPLDPEASVYQTTETIWAGTPMYMAPERFRQPSLNDPRSDLYSIGCIGYFLLTGRPPFIESDPESLFALILSEHPIGIEIHRGGEIEKEISELIFRCMAKSMEARFESVADLGREIDLLRTRHPWTTDQAKVWWSQHGGH